MITGIATTYINFTGTSAEGSLEEMHVCLEFDTPETDDQVSEPEFCTPWMNKKDVQNLIDELTKCIGNM